ncbi:MAG: cytochrome c [Cyclobacteriaceae bacterium]|nr:cytochrome c [Cyclobacteriaceae bacterium]
MKSTIALTLVVASGILMFGLSSFQKKPAIDLKASMARGRETYVTYCLSCHMDQGEGIEGVYPPLAKADYLLADKNRAIRQVLYGTSGEMTVNGKKYNLEMTGVDITDQEVSDVMNYILNSFGNKGGTVTPEQVATIRKK